MTSSSPPTQRFLQVFIPHLYPRNIVVRAVPLQRTIVLPVYEFVAREWFYRRDFTKKSEEEEEEEDEEKEKGGDDPSARHVPSAKIENLGADRIEDKRKRMQQKGRRREGQRTRCPGKIRNKKLGPREP